MVDLKKRGKGVVYLWVLVLALAVVVSACAPGAPPRALTKVTFIFPVPLEPNVGAFGNYVVAQQTGYYKEEGLDVSFLGAQGAIDGAKQVVAGNADLGSGLGPETAI